jgi:hypothetical protein
MAWLRKISFLEILLLGVVVYLAYASGRNRAQGELYITEVKSFYAKDTLNTGFKPSMAIKALHAQAEQCALAKPRPQPPMLGMDETTVKAQARKNYLTCLDQYRLEYVFSEELEKSYQAFKAYR